MKRRSAKALGDENLCYHIEEVRAGRLRLSGLKIHPPLGDFSSTVMLKKPVSSSHRKSSNQHRHLPKVILGIGYARE